MLESLKFTNYKCFKEHEIPFRSRTLIIGKNNAGKSTIVEALRLVSLVANRAPHLRFSAPPVWTERYKAHRGVQPDINDLDINFDNIFHHYSDPPATILARFANGSSVEILVGKERDRGQIHGIIRNSKNRIAQGANEAAAAGIPAIAILPQVAPVVHEEVVLESRYVQRNLSTSLASRHFRNQINRLPQFYDDFRAISQETWPGLRINTFDGWGGASGDPLRLLVQNEDFVAEIAWMGHGLQMWLQTMWFLARSKSAKLVMLDEPDVYMHPDLQRRLIRFLRSRFPQMILTTHSVEMLAEMDPKEVLIIDRRRDSSVFADSVPAMQMAIDGLGAIHNLQLSRLWGTRKLLLIEGDDMQILRRFHDLIFPDSLDSLATNPNLSIGGWGGWNYAVGSSMLLRNAGGDDIQPYCILDSDYFAPSAVKARQEDAVSKGVRLHIWQRKEIENYLIVPEAIQRIITYPGSKKPSIDQISDKIREIAEFNKDDVYDSFAESFLLQDRAGGSKTANRRARMYLDPIWSRNPDHRVSGKTLLSGLSSWSKKKFGVSFGVSALLHALRREDLATEVVDVITAIEENEAFI